MTHLLAQPEMHESCESLRAEEELVDLMQSHFLCNESRLTDHSQLENQSNHTFGMLRVVFFSHNGCSQKSLLF